LQPHGTYSKDSNEVLRRKIEDIHGVDKFGFRRGKGTWDAVEMLRNNQNKL
jgi:hypothetical protein